MAIICIRERPTSLSVGRWLEEGECGQGNGAMALAQIEERGYAAPYAADARELHLIGCTFNSESRTLVDWVER